MQEQIYKDIAKRNNYLWKNLGQNVQSVVLSIFLATNGHY